MIQIAPEVIRLPLCLRAPIGSYMPSMLSRLLSPLLLSLLTLAACRQSGPHLRYVGKTAAVISAADAIDLLAGTRPPPEYRVLGVITSRCETYDGASGLLQSPCDEPTLTSSLRDHASKVGATTLFDLRCEEEGLRREFERNENSGAVIHNLNTLICQATVLRRNEIDIPRKARQ